MNEKNNWVEQFKKIPDWIKGAIGLLITVAGFIIAFRSDRYLYSTLLGFSVFVGLLCVLTYIAFARGPSFFGTRGPYKFERYRRLALAGNTGLILIAILILNSRAGRTYLAYTMHGTPTASPTSTLPPTASPIALPTTATEAASTGEFGRLFALEPGIYVSQIIRDPESGFPKSTKFSVWLSANGNYYVDSIRVISNCTGFLSANFSGAQPPDANYVFTYTNCSGRTYALNPALNLDMADQKEVYFTLELVPDGVFGAGEGYAYAIIYYHTSDGTKGALILEEPPANMVVLSQLLNINVLSSFGSRNWREDRYELLVSPNGNQRGYEKGMEQLESVIEYAPLSLSAIYSLDLPDYALMNSYLDTDSLPLTPNIDLGARNRLNKLLIAQDKVSEIISGLSTGMPIYFDLCAGLANRECKQALLNTPFPPDYSWEEAWALTIMHLIRPDANLADFVLQNISMLSLTKNYSEINALPSQEHYYDTEDRLIFALTLHPIGSWFDALVRIAEHNDSACKALDLLKNKMDGTQLQVVKSSCNQ